MGFTAINGAIPSAVLSPKRPSPDETTIISSNRQLHPVASADLVREERPILAPPPEPTTGKLHKRGTLSCGTVQKKRRCRIRARDDVPKAKTAALGILECGDTHGMRSMEASSSEKELSVKRSIVPQISVGPLEHEQNVISFVKPISLYASPTSMDALDSTFPHTSFDSPKRNQSPSYSSHVGSTYSSTSLSKRRFSQNWLSSAPNPGHQWFDQDAEQQASSALPYRQCQQVSDLWPHHKESEMISTAKASNTFYEHKLDNTINKGSCDHFVACEAPKFFTNMVTKPIDNKSLGTGLEDVANPPSAKQETSSHTLKVDWVTANNAADDIILSDIDDDDLFAHARYIEDEIDRGLVTPTSRRRQMNVREVDENENYGGALLSDEERLFLAKFEPRQDTFQRIVRRPFPPSIQEQSPISGASKGTLLRTCFRVGEALNCGSQAVRSGTDTVLELYARVETSWREERAGGKQHFVFRDLYHDRLPHLDGIYDLWSQAELWDSDSKVFLKACKQGIMCRLIAKMAYINQRWTLKILSIWEASWEDVNHIAGIYAEDRKERAGLPTDKS